MLSSPLSGASVARLQHGEHVLLSRGRGALVLLTARLVLLVRVAAEGGDWEGCSAGAGRGLAAQCLGMITHTTLGILCVYSASPTA